jgi:hypothetical protein
LAGSLAALGALWGVKPGYIHFPHPPAGAPPPPPPSSQSSFLLPVFYILYLLAASVRRFSYVVRSVSRVALLMSCPTEPVRAQPRAPGIA